jgi:hypothetical protein
MNTRSLLAWTGTFAFASSLLVAGPANAVLIAGWDLSQYISPGGQLDTDGALPYDGTVLPANYSNLVPAQLGPTANPRGAMYMDGAFGSSEIIPLGDGSEYILPTELSLTSNLSAPVLGGNTLQFDSLGQLDAQDPNPDHQENLMKLSVLGNGAVDVVFQARTLTLPGTDWVISFGAGRSGSQNAGLAVEWSLTGDPASYQAASGGQISLTTPDAPFNVALTSSQASSIFVRLRFNGVAADFDNVAIDATIVPEPAAGLLLAAGLAGLSAWRRRRA